MHDGGFTVGAAVGAMWGGSIGARLDEHARAKQAAAHVRALDTASAAPITWRHGSASGSTRVIATGDRGTQVCHRYETLVRVDGKPDTIVGTACRNARNEWEPVAG